MIRASHRVGEANLHLQFTPKYRREIFRDEAVKGVCEESFLETASELDLVINALDFRERGKNKSFYVLQSNCFWLACRNH